MTLKAPHGLAYRRAGFARFSITLLWIWIAGLVLVPLLLTVITSVLGSSDTDLVRLEFSAASYVHLFDTVYAKAFLRSMGLALTCTLVSLLLAYPFSYHIARMNPRYRDIAFLLVIIPFWTSSLIRTYAIVALLKTKGILNALLLWLGWIDTPIRLLYTETAALVGLVYTALPMMILPLYTQLEKLDQNLLDAARDLGANRMQVLCKVIFPLSLPGVLAGCLLVFLPSLTLFYIPDVLGGAKTILIGNIIQNQFLQARNWPLGAAISVALTSMLIVCLLRYLKKPHDFPI